MRRFHFFHEWYKLQIRQYELSPILDVHRWLAAGLPIQFGVEAVSPASLLPSHSGRVTRPLPLSLSLSCEPPTHNTDSQQGVKAINSFIPEEEEDEEN